MKTNIDRPILLPKYTWLFRLYEAIKRRDKVAWQEFNFVGGRVSGKSQSVETIATLIAALTQVKTKSYFVRATVGDSSELFKEVVQVIQDLGVPFTARQQTLWLVIMKSEL